MTTTGRSSARQRLLAAADKLFYAGVHSVGIDRVIEHAGVAKATLYNAFGSKDELIKAYLLARHARRQERVARWLAGVESPASGSSPSSTRSARRSPNPASVAARSSTPAPRSPRAARSARSAKPHGAGSGRPSGNSRPRPAPPTRTAWPGNSSCSMTARRSPPNSTATSGRARWPVRSPRPWSTPRPGADRDRRTRGPTARRRGTAPSGVGAISRPGSRWTAPTGSTCWCRSHEPS